MILKANSYFSVAIHKIKADKGSIAHIEYKFVNKSSSCFSMINGSSSNSFSNFSNIIPNNHSSCKSLSNSIHDYSYYSEIYNNNYEYKIDLQILYILEAKLQNILNKINKYTVCH